MVTGLGARSCVGDGDGPPMVGTGSWELYEDAAKLALEITMLRTLLGILDRLLLYIVTCF